MGSSYWTLNKLTSLPPSNMKLAALVLAAATVAVQAYNDKSQFPTFENFPVQSMSEEVRQKRDPQYSPVPVPAYSPAPAPYAAPVPAYTPAAPAYHEPAPAYAPAAPVYHEPAPAYTPAAPAYHEPAPYHPPAPAYAPAPAYHEPAPAYAPKPAPYHAPKPAYHEPEPYHEEHHNEHGVPGHACVDYPCLAEAPYTKFTCASAPFQPGMYADVDSGCQAYRVCEDGRHGPHGAGFVCPNGTLFDQHLFRCETWNTVDCYAAPKLYALNADPLLNPFLPKPKLDEYGKPIPVPVHPAAPLHHAVHPVAHHAPIVPAVAHHAVHAAPVLAHHAPAVHALPHHAPVVAPAVHAVHAAPAVHAVHAAPAVHAVHAAPVVPAVAAPVALSHGIKPF